MHYVEYPFVNEQNDARAVKMPDIPYRRRYVRVAVATTITYTRDGEGETKSGHSSDLGGGGIRVSTDEDLPLGAVLLLRFRVPNGDREMVARGRIVLSFYNAENKQFFHGVAFTQIDPKDQDEIVRYVADEVQRLALEEDQAD
jgi:c-di-GMP-binding flagellar brake protein YcgR